MSPAARHQQAARDHLRNDAQRKFRSYLIGYFHIDIAEVQTAEGKLRLFVAIDRTSKFAVVEVHEEGGKMIAAQFLRNLVAAVPYTIHTVLTDNVLCWEALAGSAGSSIGVGNVPMLMQFEPDGFHRQRDRSLP